MAKKKRGPGRPATGQREMMWMRASTEEREKITAAAERAGKPVSTWMRDVCLKEAAATAR